MKIVKNVPLLAILFVVVNYSLAQPVEYTYKNPKDSTREYYITIHPSNDIKGCIILLNGYGQLADDVYKETKIHSYAADNGILTIIPTLSDGSFLFIDEPSQKLLDDFIKEVYKKYKLNGKKLIIGGFSIGGTGAFLYAERALSNRSDAEKPVALFGVDPPLDLERQLIQTGKEVFRGKLDVKNDKTNELLFITNRYKEAFGENLWDNEKFWLASPYRRTDMSMRNIKPLVTIPVRVYNEPDITFRRNRNPQWDFYFMNELDASSLILDLNGLGNKSAEQILTTGKGIRRITGKKHPHSWSIVDEEELVHWAIKIFENQK